MKIRTGFISNSSSSSFIVIFDTIPRSVKELKKILFGEADFFEEMCEDRKFSTEELSKVIFEDLVNHGCPLTYNQVVNECSSLVDINSDKKKYQLEDSIDWDLYYSDVRKASKKEVDEIISQYKGKYFFKFHYSDENGSFESVLEHGNIFRNLPHIYINEH